MQYPCGYRRWSSAHPIPCYSDHQVRWEGLCRYRPSTTDSPQPKSESVTTSCAGLSVRSPLVPLRTHQTIKMQRTNGTSSCLVNTACTMIRMGEWRHQSMPYQYSCDWIKISHEHTQQYRPLFILRRNWSSRHEPDTEFVARSNLLGVISASSIWTSVFIQSASENSVIIEESLCGKHTTHATTPVLYEQVQYVSRPQRGYVQITRGNDAHWILRQHVKPYWNEKKLQYQSHRPATQSREIGTQVTVPWMTVPAKWIWYRHWCCSQRTCLKKTVAQWTLIARQFPAGVRSTPWWPVFHHPSLSDYQWFIIWIQYRYIVMKKIQQMMSSLGQKAVPSLSSWPSTWRPRKYSGEIPRSLMIRQSEWVGFHFAINYMALIVKMFEDSGLTDLLVTSVTSGFNTAANMLKKIL